MKKKQFISKNIIVKVVNEGTKRNPIYRANVSSENKKRYSKIFDKAGNIIFISCINSEIYVTGNYLISFIWKYMPIKYARVFDKEDKNILGIFRNEYLRIKIPKFRDDSLIGSFTSEKEKEDALLRGFPIIYKSSTHYLFSEFGFYYEDEFDLVKYKALKRQELLTKSTELIIENLLKKKFNFETL